MLLNRRTQYLKIWHLGNRENCRSKVTLTFSHISPMQCGNKGILFLCHLKMSNDTLIPERSCPICQDKQIMNKHTSSNAPPI